MRCLSHGADSSLPMRVARGAMGETSMRVPLAFGCLRAFDTHLCSCLRSLVPTPHIHNTHRLFPSPPPVPPPLPLFLSRRPIQRPIHPTYSTLTGSSSGVLAPPKPSSVPRWRTLTVASVVKRFKIRRVIKPFRAHAPIFR